MRILLDENMPRKLQNALVAEGHEVHSVIIFLWLEIIFVIVGIVALMNTFMLHDRDA